MSYYFNQLLVWFFAGVDCTYREATWLLIRYIALRNSMSVDHYGVGGLGAQAPAPLARVLFLESGPCLQKPCLVLSCYIS